MTVQSVLLPIFVYVTLVYALLGAFIVASQRARRNGVSAEDGRARQVGASFSNQFEMPVLFFALVAFALITRKTDGVFVVLEWLFVLARIVHAGIHVTVNSQPARGMAFAASAAILSVAWVLFAIAILAA